MFRSGYIESWGRGTLKIIRECNQAGIPEPVFSYNSTEISIEFRKDIYNEKYLQSLNLNNRQIRAVLYTKDAGKITNGEYQELNETSDRTALRDLESLVSIGVFKRIGEKRGVYYKLHSGGYVG